MMLLLIRVVFLRQDSCLARYPTLTMPFKCVPVNLIRRSTWEMKENVVNDFAIE